MEAVMLSDNSVRKALQIYADSTRGQRNSLHRLAAAVRPDNADSEINFVPRPHFREQTLDLFRRGHVVFADAINHEPALDAGSISRTVRLDRANQQAFSRRVPECV